MKLLVVQWNISTMSRPKAIGDFIRERIGQEHVLVCLDEVKRSSYDKLVDSLKPQSSCFSLDLRLPGKNEGKERGTGVAVLGFGLPIVSFELMDRAVFPERTLFVLLGGAFGPIRVAAFHSLTGVGYRKAKASNFASIADYLQLHGAELDFLCFDANEPQQDSMNLDQLVFWPHGEGTIQKAALIMGSQKVHELSDSYVEYLKSTGRIDNLRNPLTVSHFTQGVPRRYDYVMHSPRWQVVNCSYPYEESHAATSDHSAVIADYELR